MSEIRYSAYGEERFASGAAPTDYRYTGQLSKMPSVGLYYYVARWYDPALGRFIQADTIVPDPGDPLDYDRFAYGRNNPLYYTDPSGHIPILPILIIGGIALMKAIDYGWTAYDAYQSSQVLADPNASQAAKDMAAANLAMTIAFEALEPDDMLPVALPLDDLARRGIIKTGKDMLEEGADKVAKVSTDEVAEGTFSIWDWSRYPSDVAPQPTGPFKIVKGEEYIAMRELASKTNQKIHDLNRPLMDKYHIHEVHPVKFGGSPTDLSNKILVSPNDHYRLNNWWNSIQRNIPRLE